MDLLTRRGIAGFARSLRVRRTVQSMVLLATVVVVVHGLTGPVIAPRNLATVTTSIHWRGLLIIGLLALGNVFCAVCPMMLVRDAARAAVTPRRRLPRWVRGKWLGVGLLLAALYGYEVFGLWERPAATAWIIVGYFVLAVVIDLIFEGASFCKHVCPVGQFNFLASTVSPSEVAVRDQNVCSACKTADCINGRQPAAPVLPVLRGCELGLFLPAKAGNLDCTLCFDCVRACPHDNVTLATRVPALEWLNTTRRSGLGRVHDRADVVALALVFTFGALLSAFVMTTPGHDARQWVASAFGVGPAAALLGVFAAVLAMASLASTVVSRASHWAAPASSGLPLTLADVVFALVPFGFAVWVAHYGFHLLTGVLTVIPVTQSAVDDLFGRAWLGSPAWRLAGMRPGLVLPFQIGCVVLGALGSIGLVQGALRRQRPSTSALAALPGVMLVVVLALAALWTLAQPMDMRGVGGLG